jgi:hypothetical protein
MVRCTNVATEAGGAEHRCAAAPLRRCAARHDDRRISGIAIHRLR